MHWALTKSIMVILHTKIQIQIVICFREKFLRAENLHSDSKRWKLSQYDAGWIPTLSTTLASSNIQKSKTKLTQCITEAINKQNNTGGKRNAKERKKES